MLTNGSQRGVLHNQGSEEIHAVIKGCLTHPPIRMRTKEEGEVPGFRPEPASGLSLCYDLKRGIQDEG